MINAVADFYTDHSDVTCSGMDNGEIWLESDSGSANSFYLVANSDTLQVNSFENSNFGFTGLARGIYELVNSNSQACGINEESIIINEPLPVMASFVADDVVNTGDTVYFQNTSFGASSYAWSFKKWNVLN